MKIYIADHQARIRYGMRVFLEQQPGWKVTEEIADTSSLLAQVDGDCPDLILLDWDLPGMPVERLLPALHQACPRLRVIVMSGQDGLRQIVMKAGGDAFVSKTEPPERLITMIQQIIEKPEHYTNIDKQQLRERVESDDDGNKVSS
jgi:DNA-binding NarL/FixJ family response regulator